MPVRKTHCATDPAIQFMFRLILCMHSVCAYQTHAIEWLETNLTPRPQNAQISFVQFDEEKGTFCTNPKITDVPQPCVIEI